MNRPTPLSYVTSTPLMSVLLQYHGALVFVPPTLVFERPPHTQPTASLDTGARVLLITPIILLKQSYNILETSLKNRPQEVSVEVPGAGR